MVPNSGWRFPFRLFANDNSEFSLQALAPGSYTVLAFDTLRELEYMNPDVLEPFLSLGAHVDVSAGQESTVMVELIMRGSE